MIDIKNENTQGQEQGQEQNQIIQRSSIKSLKDQEWKYPKVKPKVQEWYQEQRYPKIKPKVQKRYQEWKYTRSRTKYLRSRTKIPIKIKS